MASSVCDGAGWMVHSPPPGEVSPRATGSTRAAYVAVVLDLDKLTSGLGQIWATYLRDWDRTLRSADYPETTRYNYLLAAAQLGGYLAEHSPDPEADAAAEDPTEVTRAHVEAFHAWMIEIRSASIALNKGKGLREVPELLQV